VPSGTLGPDLTFALACASATFFLFLRCHGQGRPFGPNSRRWAIAVIAVTGVVSTAATFAFVAVVNELPSVFFSLGVLAPSGLWLAEIRSRSDGRRSLLRDMSTLWLTRLLARLHEGMAEDRVAWCERRIDESWTTDELGMAARFYQEYLRERLSPDERRRGRIYAQLSAIEARLTVEQLIENGAGRTKVVAALQGSRATKDPRYSRYHSDLSRLAGILRHDAERDLVRLLGSAYSAGHYKTPVYIRPRRAYQATADGRPGGPP
jgi:hypothetical protein